MTQPEPRSVHVVNFVLEDGNLRRWRTHPGRLGGETRPENEKIKRGDWIRWQAPPSSEDSRDKEVILFFPDETIFGTNHVKVPFGDKITLEVKREGRKDPETQRLEENLYAAYCPKGFAEGESNPIIIIEE